jgi:hypothetical protein
VPPPDPPPPSPPPPSPPPPDPCATIPFALDFTNSVIRFNNLGGMGPLDVDCGSDINPEGIADPQELRYDGVGVYNGRVVSMVVKNTSRYLPNEGKCGKGSQSNGRKGAFGRINLGTNQAAEFGYFFVYNDTSSSVLLPELANELASGYGTGRLSSANVTIPLFDMSFYDFDDGTLSYGVNSLDANGNPATVYNTSMVTPDCRLSPNGRVACEANKAERKSYDAMANKLREICAPILNADGSTKFFGPGEAAPFGRGAKKNKNGLDGVHEVMRTEGFTAYYIKNEGVMCNARSGPACPPPPPGGGKAPTCTDPYLKQNILDSDENSPAGGYTPTGDPSYSWLQNSGLYCQVGRGGTATGGAPDVNWMYTNYPCTEVTTVIQGDGRRRFKSTVRGYGCDNPSDPGALNPVQEARRVSVTYEKQYAVLIEYEVESSSCYSYFTGGRNFLFTGVGSGRCAPPSPPPGSGR